MFSKFETAYLDRHENSITMFRIGRDNIVYYVLTTEKLIVDATYNDK